MFCFLNFLLRNDVNIFSLNLHVCVSKLYLCQLLVFGIAGDRRSTACDTHHWLLVSAHCLPSDLHYWTIYSLPIFRL